MAIEPPPTQPGYEGRPPQDHKTAKANAKAATAYAKAQRPWFKKKRYWLLMAVGLIVVIAIAGNAGGGGNTTASQPADPSAAQPSAAQPSAATPTKAAPAGAGTTFGNWEVQGKLTPVDDGIGDFGMTFRVLNTGSTSDRGLFTVDVLKGDTILTALTCFTSNVAPGSIGTAQCSSTDGFQTGWTNITIENAI